MNAAQPTTAHDNRVASFDHDFCPRHPRSAFRKCYLFGSTMSAETEVYTFRGCGCAVSVSHDPVGTYPSVARLHADYNDAAGLGRLRAMDAAAKYR